MSIKSSIMKYVQQGVNSMDPVQRQRVRDFTVSQVTREAGFADRDGKVDLYYTVFGLQLLDAFDVDIPYERVAGFLQSFYPYIEEMDLLEVASLGRCSGCLPLEYKHNSISDRIAERITAFASLDGGYGMTVGDERGSIYAAFLAMGALQDLEIILTNPRGMVDSIESLALKDGSYVNDNQMPVGLVPSTAAAVVMLDILVGVVAPASIEWLKSCYCVEGGLAAVPGGTPDLLSTGVGLFTLASNKSDFEDMKYDSGRFVDAMQKDNGGFCGSSDDNTSDCEYTYYGLLTKGIVNSNS